MVRVLMVAALATLSACASAPYAPYVSIGGGGRIVNGEWGPAGCLEIGQRFRERTSWEYAHCSDPARGRPVNDRPDVSHDALMLKHTFGGGAR